MKNEEVNFNGTNDVSDVGMRLSIETDESPFQVYNAFEVVKVFVYVKIGISIILK